MVIRKVVPAEVRRATAEEIHEDKLAAGGARMEKKVTLVEDQMDPEDLGINDRLSNIESNDHIHEFWTMYRASARELFFYKYI